RNGDLVVLLCVERRENRLYTAGGREHFVFAAHGANKLVQLDPRGFEAAGPFLGFVYAEAADHGFERDIDFHRSIVDPQDGFVGTLELGIGKDADDAEEFAADLKIELERIADVFGFVEQPRPDHAYAATLLTVGIVENPAHHGLQPQFGVIAGRYA